MLFCLDELKNFFSKHGKVVEHQIIRDHETNRSRGFGFVIFDSEDAVDEMLSKGNMIDMAGTQVSLFERYCRDQHVNTILFILEHASFLSLFMLLIYVAGVVGSSILNIYLIRKTTLVVFVSNYRWRLLQA